MVSLLNQNKRQIYPYLIYVIESQARTFFLGGTVVTFLLFIGLTVYSFMPKNDQTNHDAIDQKVVRGKELWESNNCMGCHTILGEGGYYAPELTK